LVAVAVVRPVLEQEALVVQVAAEAGKEHNLVALVQRAKVILAELALVLAGLLVEAEARVL
jgi:hypothetical protein